MTEAELQSANDKKTASDQLASMIAFFETPTPGSLEISDLINVGSSIRSKMNVSGDDARIKTAIDAIVVTAYESLRDDLTTLQATIDEELTDIIGTDPTE